MMYDEGQISIDFLLGISLFMITLVFVIQVIPSLFVSVSGEGSLNSVAYRTANILVEDPGWWQNETDNGTDWENQNISDVSRIGLALGRANDTKTRLTDTPNMLNETKIQQAVRLYNENETIVTSKLGIYDRISGSQVDYGYNISLYNIPEQNGPMVINGTTFTFGKIPPTTQDLFKITRLVLVENGSVASYRAEELSNTVNVTINGSQDSKVVVRIMNLTENQTFNGAKVNGGDINRPDNYTAWKETNYSDYFSYDNSSPWNNTDYLRLIFNQSLFNNSVNYLELNFSNITLGSVNITYSDREEPLYEPASLVVEVWK